jgi:quinol monooxygenase YgiN
VRALPPPKGEKMSRTGIFVKFTAKAGQRDELVKALQTAIDNVENEPGTLVYLVHTDNKDENAVWLYEQYPDRAALDAHSSADWMKSFGPTLGPLLEGRMEMHLATLVGGKGAPA